MLAEIDRPLDVVFELQVPTTSRASGSRSARAEEGRADDTPRRSTPGSRRTTARPSRSSSTTARAGTSSAIHGDRTVERGLRQIQDALEQVGGAGSDRPQVRARDRADGARPGASSPTRSRMLGEQLEPGVTTGELDRIAEEFIRSQGGVPTSKGYRGFPAAICISPNDMIVHGIPGAYRVEEGDIALVRRRRHARRLVADSAVHVRRSARSPPRPQRLLDVGQAALGGRDRAGARRATGSATSRPPSRRDRGGRLLGRPRPRRPRRRPLLPRGSPDPELRHPGTRAGARRGHDARDRADDHRRRRGHRTCDDDQWSISTADGSLSAHFEHTVAVTEEGPRILTPARSRFATVSRRPNGHLFVCFSGLE